MTIDWKDSICLGHPEVSALCRILSHTLYADLLSNIANMFRLTTLRDTPVFWHIGTHARKCLAGAFETNLSRWGSRCPSKRRFDRIAISSPTPTAQRVASQENRLRCHEFIADVRHSPRSYPQYRSFGPISALGPDWNSYQYAPGLHGVPIPKLLT